VARGPGFALQSPDAPPAILLRESFRENGKVRNRTLANLSCWATARLEALCRKLGGEFDQAANFAPGPPLGRVFGRLLAFRQIADVLGPGATLGYHRLAKLALFLPTTVVEQIQILHKQFQVEELVFVRDGGW